MMRQYNQNDKTHQLLMIKLDTPPTKIFGAERIYMNYEYDTQSPESNRRDFSHDRSTAQSSDVWGGAVYGR